ncbi:MULTISPECIES: DUF1850 domain-containing protein [Virgibacillus]|uniref:DUF1850 domain-containing protein n=1 Tax=Virgibacillus massiliensis TaxID=1462526 RepID=A0A024Q6N4_9BACI|nr:MULTISPECIES: DUF1850 domain-containing protein [Virgibacillus]CDQ38193.1 hypothetical protein BN990_00460 [Virgibacillus massiliensis]
MKLLQKYNIFVIMLLVIVISLVFILFFPFRSSLVFYKENTDHIAAYLPINKGEHFQLIFKHSIHLTDVVEKYVVNDDQTIKQTEIVYEEFGIGMPSNAHGNEKFTYENGKYHIKNLSNVFPKINLRNGKTVSKNRLVWGENADKEIYLNKYFNPGAWFTLKIENITLWEYWKGVRIHE